MKSSVVSSMLVVLLLLLVFPHGEQRELQKLSGVETYHPGQVTVQARGIPGIHIPEPKPNIHIPPNFQFPPRRPTLPPGTKCPNGKKYVAFCKKYKIPFASPPPPRFL
ncbi:hypothetical protein EUTSA_v10015083mg [Eutrema salsugineum]|uniref:Uncharacterized protein n=2 Tax=Eutrema TaxID=98005 RepID=V4LBU9_EUTSA|nr:ST120 [Eutrema halophilum]ESQ41153.1 hypothetical protein EUTSA_v10015083mg [Eutrema salsugineum]ESQ41154.1 hypothetical protein EUTSA_v10015083mg [Eutrema salsugineum]